MQLALKIDVDTFRGTREGVPRLADLLERLGVQATFLFSVGPDHTGRAIRRAFQPGFVRKVKRTSVVAHYGWRTLIYGTLLPGPHIGRRCAAVMRSVARRGFEVGVHGYDHVKWQDGVASASANWTRRELELAREQFQELFQRPPEVHAAAGWQVNDYVPNLERELGFRYASDVRGHRPFIPVVDGRVSGVPQLPTTLPTLDELIGRSDLQGVTPVGHLARLTAASPDRDHVYTLHAELEGGRYLESFEQLLQSWQGQGRRLGCLSEYYGTLDTAGLPQCEIVARQVAGRAGILACQGRSTHEVIEGK